MPVKKSTADKSKLVKPGPKAKAPRKTTKKALLHDITNDTISEKEYNALDPITDRERIWAETYVSTLNRTRASEAINIPFASRRQQGYLLYNRPRVKAYIDQLLSEAAMTGDEAVKQVTDIALTDIKDYYVPVTVRKQDLIEKPLAAVIGELQAEIDFEQEVSDNLEMGAKELKRFHEEQKHRKRQLVRLKLELKKNPGATRITYGPEYLTQEMQLDINLLVADKERGKVKKVKYGRDGLEVEMYSAADANDKILRINGKFEKDNDQQRVKIINVIAPPDDDDE